MTSRRPPCAVSLVGDNFALLSGRRLGLPRVKRLRGDAGAVPRPPAAAVFTAGASSRCRTKALVAGLPGPSAGAARVRAGRREVVPASPRGRLGPGSGGGDAAECDGTSRPVVKREKPATATRTVTRLPPFLPPGVLTGLFEPFRKRPSQISAAQLAGGSQSRVKHHVPRLSAITETRPATVADATGLTPWATGSRCRTRTAVHVSSPPPNRANTSPAKIAGPLSMVPLAPFLLSASAQPGEAVTHGRRAGEPRVNAGPTRGRRGADAAVDSP